MEFVGSISGCELSFGPSVVGDPAVYCTAGKIHFSNGSVVDIIPSSSSITLAEKPRRVRAYISGVFPGHSMFADGVSSPVGPQFYWLGSTNLFMQLDDDQNVTRGVYAGGLVVLGHVDIPAKRASPESNANDGKEMKTRERNNLLRVIRALAEMNQIPTKGYAESIRTKLETLGLSAPSDDTIRKAIEDSRALDS